MQRRLSSLQRSSKIANWIAKRKRQLTIQQQMDDKTKSRLRWQ